MRYPAGSAKDDLKRGVFAQPRLGELYAKAGLLDAPEGYVGLNRAMFVDPGRAAFQPLRHAARRLDICGPDRSAQPVRIVVAAAIAASRSR